MAVRIYLHCDRCGFHELFKEKVSIASIFLNIVISPFYSEFTSRGWAEINGKLLCPKCNNKYKSYKDKFFEDLIKTDIREVAW